MVVTACCDQPLIWSADFDWWDCRHAAGCTSRWRPLPPGPRVVAAQRCARCGRLIGSGRWCDDCLAAVAEAALAQQSARQLPEPVMVQPPGAGPCDQPPAPPVMADSPGPGPQLPACQVCAAPYQPAVPWQRYCSPACHVAARCARNRQARRDRPRPPCPVCGLPVPPGRGRQYCSSACKHRAAQRAYRQRRRYQQTVAALERPQTLQDALAG